MTKQELRYSNNAGVIKLIAAIFVIISHAFPISVIGGVDVLEKITKGHLSLGGLSVAVFFFLSGLLVSNSLLNKPDMTKYLMKRIERVFPPLICVVVLCVFVLGPCMTNMSYRAYFSNSETYLYLLNGVCILRHDLPGVFVGNAYGSVVNGSLWTMPLEVAGYIVVALLYRLKFFDRRIFTIISVAAFLGWCYIAISDCDIVIYVSYRACLMFCFGIFARVFWDKIRFNIIIFIVSVIALACTCSTQVFPILFVILFPYILICLCWMLPQVPDFLGQLGHISYGVYLVGFPIQQTVVYLFGGTMSAFVNILISVPIAIIFGGTVIRISNSLIRFIGVQKKYDI